LLVQGSLQLNWEDLSTSVKGSIQIDAPSRVSISANVWHEVKAITDIVFVELNSLKDGNEDTYRL
jgi:quercetin dioxygenase-like cupin family protein